VPNRSIGIALALLVGLTAAPAAAQRTSAGKYFEKPPEWFASEEGRQIASNILSHQTPLGGWPKNIDTAAKTFEGDPATLTATYDNSATTDELRFLGRAASATGDKQYVDAFTRGLEYILDSQYPNGGWPQSSPPGHGYDRYITFNDGAMIRVMFFLREVVRENRYSFVAPELRHRCQQAWGRGIDVILKCQIRVDGKLTAWCAQHDELTLEPRPARSFELASISGCETIGIVNALMAVEHPSAEVIAAVESAVAWLESVKIPGIRIEDRPQEGTPRGYERFVVKDPSAPPMWARFYEIGTNRPIFADRDGVKKYDLSEIGVERRTGYQWLKYWPKNLLEKGYPEWKARLATTGK
jgi:PelA/Pel-15E family pectate lyase